MLTLSGNNPHPRTERVQEEGLGSSPRCLGTSLGIQRFRSSHVHVAGKSKDLGYTRLLDLNSVTERWEPQKSHRLEQLRTPGLVLGILCIQLLATLMPKMEHCTV